MNFLKTHFNYVFTDLSKAKEKNCLSPSDRVLKKNLTWGVAKKIFFSCIFRNIVVLFYSFLYLNSTHYVYLKWFISVETSSWYICNIFKTRDNFFQYILICKFITIKDWIDSIERRYKIKKKKKWIKKEQKHINERNSCSLQK